VPIKCQQLQRREDKMPTPWLERIRDAGQLKVFNKAANWADAVHGAITLFNTLPFNVQMVAEKQEKSANVVLLLASGAQQYKYYGDTVGTDSSFKGDTLHGDTQTLIDEKKNEIFFAAVFLPGKAKPTKGQKEVVLVHELIHACGVQEHESIGIMFAQMKEADGGLIEYLPDKDAKPMPPIRVGPQTLCRMQTVWGGTGSCKT
jgi:hypothetical protein